MSFSDAVRWVALIVLGFLFRPDPPAKPKAAVLEDFDIPTATEGKEIPVLFGTRDIKNSNVMWYGDFKTRAIKKRGGKK